MQHRTSPYLAESEGESRPAGIKKLDVEHMLSVSSAPIAAALHRKLGLWPEKIKKKVAWSGAKQTFVTSPTNGPRI